MSGYEFFAILAFGIVVIGGFYFYIIGKGS
jgi:hypothetical protein